MPTILYRTTATAGDDFLIQYTGSQVADGLEGDDFILADSFTPFATGTTNSSASPQNTDNYLAWTTMENPFFNDAAIPHTSLYIIADAGQTHYSSVTIGAGQTITVDIDFGSNQLIGTDTDVVVTIYNSSGTLVASSDDGNGTFDLGDEGSNSGVDSFVTFTNESASEEVFTIRFSEYGDQIFEGGETFVANISVTGHPSSGDGGGNDLLHGGLGNDTIAGQWGDDSLYGDDGNDVLIGGTGTDILDGGEGEDRVSYADASSAVDVDLRITSGQNTEGAGTDTLIAIEQVSGSAFGDRLVGNDSNNTLFGSGGDDVLIGGLGNDALNGGYGIDTVDYRSATASISMVGGNVTGGAGSDTLSSIENIIGSNYNDTIEGTSTDNVLRGEDGSDTIRGGLGDDILDGGEGNDTVSYAGLMDGVTVDLNRSGAQDTGGGGVDTLSDFEDITGTFNNDTLIGDDQNNVLDGAIGDDQVLGGGGNDIIYAYLGNDFVDGGDQNDIVYANDGSDVLLGGSGADILYGEAGTDTLFGGADADIISGGIENDTLYGDDGDDILSGDAGADRLYGGADNDTLRGLAGTDTLDGGTGRDRADYSAATGDIYIDLSETDYQYTFSDGYDRLTSIEDVQGSAYNDELVGSSANNELNGGAGNDTLMGAAGDDVLVGGIGVNLLFGGDGRDTASYAGAEVGVSVSLAISEQQTVNITTLDTLSGIENLRGSSHDDALIGDDAINYLYGDTGADSLSGGLGNDRLYGEAGIDTLNGGGGDDVLDGGFDNDTMNGGAGNDRISDGRGNNTLNGGDGDDELTAGGGEDLLNGDDGNDLAFGGNGIDTLNGGAGDDHLRAGNDDDTLNGQADNDRLVAGNGNDGLHGGTGNDLLYGDAGNDTLNGSDGADQLYGGENSDTLTGGTGVDRFRLDSLIGRDTITDFSVVDDFLMLDAATFTAFTANGTLNASMLRLGGSAADANDYLIYDQATGRIFYDADANGAGAQQLIATVTVGTALTSADIVIYGATASTAMAPASAPGPVAMELPVIEPLNARHEITAAEPVRTPWFDQEPLDYLLL
ncbi:calcium-binding protein [Sphingomonas sabuli]|uniref:Calcium-binding protein n=1 Tax=Sphingomonas sabuli TaxID=2764186 RepID=A0A7G9L4E9_9SPHN|nr:calcium-binding protein [Sphingomonas sabuli]QNM83498.1 calcium-binding protein [Sphingomonas sabuli]